MKDLESSHSIPARRGATVSVAIATFNRSRMVVEAVEAALAQTLAPSEVVVSDDASSDNTWARLNEARTGAPQLRIFRQEQNSGGVDNWNFAIEQTQGDYIAWCSDDDRFLPDHLAASVDYLERHPAVGLVHSGFVDVLERGARPAGDGPSDRGTSADAWHVEEVRRRLRYPETHVLRREDLLGYLTRYYDWPFHPSTIVMRRKVWNQVGRFDNTYALADTDWFVRAAERFPVALLARHGVRNRRHPGNWSNRLGSARMQKEIFEIVEQAIARRFPQGGWEAATWRTLWRSNVRARLLLTLIERLREGRADPAVAAWEQMTAGTGRTAPAWLSNAGRGWIERIGRSRALGAQASGRGAGESVSPL